MGIFKDFLSAMLSGSASSNSQIDERPARYTPEEFVILEQEQSGQKWHGVLLSDLSKLARQTFRGKYVKVDEYNFLVFYYSSKSRKTQQSAQCELDENGRIVRLPHRYYPGQWRDSADDFVELANQQFTFR
ncbi:MAG: hypothetical protein ACLT1X_04385 [Christensenellales bacterium]